jgi:hypothetical protein
MNCCENTALAAEKNHLDCIKKLRSEGIEWHSWTSCSAAENNNLEILKYLHSQGVKWHYQTAYWAAIHGQLECLKYVHKQSGCELNSYITSHLAYYNKLECLLYCLDNECTIHPELLNKLYNNQTDKNLLTNLLLRKILTHKRLKDDIVVDKYPEFYKLIQEYKQFINKFYQFIESNTNLPTDVIKYELVKYI